MKSRIFLDSNIYIAGLASRTGASAEILRLAEKKKFELLISPLVIKESERNIGKKFPHSFPYLHFALKKIKPKIVKQTVGLDSDLDKIFPKRSDQTIFKTVQKAKIDYFVTLNRKHFHTPKIKSLANFKILTPAEFLDILRK